MGAAHPEAFADMAALEKGAIANPDEKRMVGHYWLRAPQLAPDPGDRATRSTSTLAAIKDFAAKVHSGAIAGPAGQVPPPAGHRHRRLGARARSS